MTENNCYRELIQNSSYPIVFRDCLKWEILKWNLEDWSSKFKNQELPFRVADRTCRRQPVWETSCRTENHTMQELIEFCINKEKTEREWWYLDYKHIPEFIPSYRQLFQTISWQGVGFPDKGAECSTIWIGTPGAHTPCHYDSYGCNIVAQVLGRLKYLKIHGGLHKSKTGIARAYNIQKRNLIEHLLLKNRTSEKQMQPPDTKRWLLFHPSQSKILKPTRVPYEESSVYSSINFSCREQIKGSELTKCYKVDLNPGDVLLVPPKWWHYVENLSLAISVNAWIAQADDDIYRLEEALVRYLISSVTESLSADLKKLILNPNELDIEHNSLLLDLIKYCKGKCQQMEKMRKNSPEPLGRHQSVYHNHNYSFIRETPIIASELVPGERTKCCDGKRFDRSDPEDMSVSYNVKSLESIVNAFCHPEIISQVKDKILER